MTDMPSIPTLSLPGGGRMPKLGLGTWPMRGAECRRAVESALSLGYRHIDTAEMYGNEADIGAAVAASALPRDTLFVTTKVWHDHLTPAGIRAACEASLGRLGLGYADLYLVHWPSPAMDLDAVLGAMARLKEDGLARAVGVSNFPPGLLRRALGTGAPIACADPPRRRRPDGLLADRQGRGGEGPGAAKHRPQARPHPDAGRARLALGAGRGRGHPEGGGGGEPARQPRGRVLAARRGGPGRDRRAPQGPALGGPGPRRRLERLTARHAHARGFVRFHAA